LKPGNVDVKVTAVVKPEGQIAGLSDKLSADAFKPMSFRGLTVVDPPAYSTFKYWSPNGP
jgi:hypothetical protein